MVARRISVGGLGRSTLGQRRMDWVLGICVFQPVLVQITMPVYLRHSSSASAFTAGAADGGLVELEGQDRGFVNFVGIFK
jgi:hypothetical protein